MLQEECYAITDMGNVYWFHLPACPWLLYNRYQNAGIAIWHAAEG